MLMKISKTLLSVLIVSALVGSVVGIRNAKGKAAEGPQMSLLAAPKAAGNAAARIRVIEFIDYQCPSCAKASFFLHELVKRHPQDVYLEVKYFPLNGHAHSVTSATLVECARMQGKFWEAHYALFTAQPAWRDLDDAKPVLMQALQAAGVDISDVDRCQTDPEIAKQVAAERQAALKLGLKSTPTFYINGEMIVGYMAMSEKMQQLLPDAASIVLPPDNLLPPPPAPSSGEESPEPTPSVVYAEKNQ